MAFSANMRYDRALANQRESFTGRISPSAIRSVPLNGAKAGRIPFYGYCPKKTASENAYQDVGREKVSRSRRRHHYLFAAQRLRPRRNRVAVAIAVVAAAIAAAIAVAAVLVASGGVAVVSVHHRR